MIESREWRLTMHLCLDENQDWNDNEQSNIDILLQALHGS